MSFEKQIGEIYRLKVPFEDLYTSVFLLKTENGNVLVDCATTKKDVQDWILPALKEMGLSMQDIQFLILTHKHGDHAGGLTEILKLNPTIEIINPGCQFFENWEIYPLQGHTEDCIGVLDVRTGTLISGDGLQGAGIGRYRCSLENKEEYIKTIEKIRRDERIKNILFSHAYEPWYKDGAFGRKEVNKCLLDCEEFVINKPYISILGDSISTFEGYSNNTTRNTTTKDNGVYYGGEGHTGSSYPFCVEDCWWYKSAHQAGLRILVNNSWSGDGVCQLGQLRCEQLHSDVLNINPDIIAVYIGINDYNHGLSVEDFYKNYATMVAKIKKKYQAKVFLFTLLPNGLCFDYGRDLGELPAFNQKIKEIAVQYNCSVVDLYENSAITNINYSQFMFDEKLHPNVQGHKVIAKCFMEIIKKENLK